MVSLINDDNLSIISVVSWICTDDLEMDAEILEFGWRLLQVYFYGVDKFVLPRFYRTFPLCEGGKGENEVWKLREGKMKGKIIVNYWYTVGMKFEGKKQTNWKREGFGPSQGGE